MDSDLEEEETRGDVKKRHHEITTPEPNSLSTPHHERSTAEPKPFMMPHASQTDDSEVAGEEVRHSQTDDSEVAGEEVRHSQTDDSEVGKKFVTIFRLFICCNLLHLFSDLTWVQTCLLSVN